jgi:hypothetical protein
MPLAVPTVYFAKSERQPIALRGQIWRGVRGVIAVERPYLPDRGLKSRNFTSAFRLTYG